MKNTRERFAELYHKGLIEISHIKEEDIDYEIRFMISSPNAYSIYDSEWPAYNIEAYNFAISQLLGGNNVIHSKTK